MCLSPWVSIPGGGGDGGDISPPPNILGGGGGMACIIIPPPPPPNNSLLNVILYRQISEVQTNIMKEIASFECRNAKIFIARFARSHIDYLDVGVLPAVCEAFVVLSIGKLHRM